MIVRAPTSADAAAWTAMRHALWPEGTVDDHREEVLAALAAPTGKAAAFLACDAGGRPAGFAEAAIRHDYVNGCDTSPVAFLEGIYVGPAWRGHGVGRMLVDAVRGWARQSGCRELASDALIGNRASHRFHRAIGFAETERVVYFRQLI